MRELTLNKMDKSYYQPNIKPISAAKRGYHDGQFDVVLACLHDSLNDQVSIDLVLRGKGLCIIVIGVTKGLNNELWVSGKVIQHNGRTITKAAITTFRFSDIQEVVIHP
jgi:hypothetical protein